MYIGMDVEANMLWYVLRYYPWNFSWRANVKDDKLQENGSPSRNLNQGLPEY
jgi:hypothetical protein